MKQNAENTPLLQATIGLTAAPALFFVKTGTPEPQLSLSQARGANGFSIQLEAAFPYAALSNVANGYLEGRRFELSEGFIKQHIIIKRCNILSHADKIAVQVQFSGSFSGTLYFTGIPYYNPALQRIELQNFAYDLNTTNFLLKGAKWLFNKVILEEIQKHTVLDLSAYFTKATNAVHAVLNKELTKGVQAEGALDAIVITGIEPQQSGLLIKSQCSGRLKLTLSELKF